MVDCLIKLNKKDEAIFSINKAIEYSITGNNKNVTTRKKRTEYHSEIKTIDQAFDYLEKKNIEEDEFNKFDCSAKVAFFYLSF